MPCFPNNPRGICLGSHQPRRRHCSHSIIALVSVVVVRGRVKVRVRMVVVVVVVVVVVAAVLLAVAAAAAVAVAVAGGGSSGRTRRRRRSSSPFHGLLSQALSSSSGFSIRLAARRIRCPPKAWHSFCDLAGPIANVDFEDHQFLLVATTRPIVLVFLQNKKCDPDV